MADRHGYSDLDVDVGAKISHGLFCIPAQWQICHGTQEVAVELTKLPKAVTTFAVRPIPGLRPSLKTTPSQHEFLRPRPVLMPKQIH